MKKLIAAFVLLGCTIAAWLYFERLESSIENNAKSKVDADYARQENEHYLGGLINGATSSAELGGPTEIMVKDFAKLSQKFYLKRSLLYFEEAEVNLRRAVEIETAAGGIGDSLHPLTKLALDKAVKLYEKARKEVEKVKEDKDDDLNFYTNYLKGEISYRFLELIADKESAPEIFNQTVMYYKQALRCKPNDINTVVNIELLIKNKDKLMGSGTGPQQRKKQMLNSKKFGVNKSSGN